MTTRDGSRAWPHRPLRFIWQSDAKGRFTIDSQEFVELMGPARAALLGSPWLEIAAALGVDGDGRVAQALASRETWSGLELAWPVGQDSASMLVELSGLPVFDRERNFGGHRGFGVCRGSVRDVAPVPEARAALVEAETAGNTRLRASIDALTQMATGAATASVISLRPGASASLISQAAEKVVRLRPANEPNTPVLTPGEANAFHELTRQLTERLRAAAEPQPEPPATSQATQIEQTLPCRDRETAPAPMARAEDPDLRTTLEGALEARRRAEQISAVKSDLVDRLIVEIRGALDAGASAGSLRSLIDDLDHLARAASGEARLARTELALNPLVQRCVADMQPRANRERVIIRSSLSASLPPVVVDQRTMQAMLIELLSRSLDHAGSGRLVTLSTGTGEAGQVALRLRGADGGPTDTGRVPRDLERDLAVARALAQSIGASLTLNRTHGTPTLVEVMFPPPGAPS